MSDLSVIISPPELVRSRAWECALVLVGEYPDRLADDRHGDNASLVLRSGPGRLTWGQIGAMFRLFGRQVEPRT
jgi:hypothetical protein